MLVNFHPGGWYLEVAGKLIDITAAEQAALVKAGVPTRDLVGISKGRYDSA